MKKITKVVLKNFMSHKHTEVEFSDFTAIIGPTDNGKSALMKGMYKVLFNTPSGDDFVRREYDTEYGEDENGEEVIISQVQRDELTFKGTVYFDDNTSICRSKGPKVNYYELINEEGETLRLEAFGVGPVKEVLDFHGMREVDFFGNKQFLNVAEQFDQPFFLAESPVTRAIMIGKIGNTDVVDLAIKNTDVDLRSVKAEAKKDKAELKDVTDELKDLKGLLKMGKDIDKIKENMVKISEIATKIDSISRCKESIYTETNRKSRLETIVSREEAIKSLLGEIEKAEVMIKRVNDINKVNMKLLSERQKQSDINSFLQKVDIFQLSEISDNVDSAVGLLGRALQVNRVFEKLKAEKLKSEKLVGLINGLDEVDSAIDKIDKCKSALNLKTRISSAFDKVHSEKNRKSKGDKVISNLQSDMDEKIKDYMDGLLENPICPMCASAISGDKIEDMRKIF